MLTELWLFTMRFPFGNGEAFLENELPFLAKGFERVRLFPLSGTGQARSLPPGVEVERAFNAEEAYRPISPWRMLPGLPRILRVWWQAKASAPSPSVFRKHKREFLSQLRQALERERLLRLRIGKQFDPESVRLYSYWTSDWATVLGLWGLRDQRVRYISRMHGFDLYADRAPDEWPRFQAFHVAQASLILVASQAGLDDLSVRYPNQRKTFQLARLGTLDNGLGPWEPAAELRIASCSNLVELKRVVLIAEALRYMSGPVRWTHFGDGPERAGVEAVVKTLPPNILVELMGSRPNAEVIAWYKARPVDVFVHASSTEGGAPVALQEAASFGIPLVAADAGGVREVVTAESGVLLPHALTPEMLGSTLNDFRNSSWHTAGARSGVRRFWASMFNATEVYGGLLKELLKR